MGSSAHPAGGGRPVRSELMMVSFRVIQAGVVALTVILCARVSVAQDQVQSWTTDNGLPQNVVTSVIQSRDGYIWLATLDGLVRFDGVRFTVFGRSNAPGILNNRLIGLYEAADGAIWAGTENGGVLRYHQGTFTAYTAHDGLPQSYVEAVTGDENGHIWVICNGKVLRWDGTRFHPDDLGGITATFYRSVWNSEIFFARDSNGIHRFTRGRITTQRVPAALQGHDIVRYEEDSSGTLWFKTSRDLIGRITDGEARFERPLAADQTIAFQAAYRDRSERWRELPVSPGLVRMWPFEGTSRPPLPFMAMFEDREGNTWLGTDGRGLYRIRKPRVGIYSRAHGLLGQNIYPVYADHAGSIWLGTWPSGMSRITDGKVTNFTVRDGLASGEATSIAEDAQDRLWVATHGSYGGLRVFENGRFREVGRNLVPLNALIYAILHERDGGMWLGTSLGLAHYENGTVKFFTSRDGLPGDQIKVLLDGGDGRLWIGTDSGLTLWEHGAFKSWTERDGLPGGVIRSLHLDRDGVLWIGTYDGGLGRLKNGRFNRFTVAQGLFDDGVFQILEDHRGNLWMGSNRGIQRVSKRDLDAVADGRATRVTALSLGRGDGLLNAECNGGVWPAGAAGRDGTLWIPTQDGVAVIDPDAIADAAVDHVPPIIESVRIDRTLMPAGAPIRMLPGQEALEVEYTGLSLVNSERIHFRYRIVGLDREWVEAGTRRTAYYSHLPPGKYTFSVTAAGSDGLWTNDVASIALEVVPPFWRTWWFLTLMLVTAVSAGGFAYRRRVDGLEAARAAQESFARQLIDSQEVERRRIAAELHDSLGQHLIVIKNRALLGSLNGEERGREQFDEISAAATLSIDEVKQIAYNLRPYHLDKLGLRTSIEAMAERVGASSDIEFIASVPPLGGAIAKEQEINVYRIVQELLNNVVKHSGARHASVDVTRNGADVVITVEDDGRGFDVRQVKRATIGSGFGLTGLAERVGMLGGRHSIESAPGQGTTVTIIIPEQSIEASQA